MTWLGDFPEDFASVVCMFTTHAGDGSPVAPLSAFENADVRIYKNGSATEKTTQNGMTMTSPFDSITGLHCLTIDTSVDTGDSGFWVAGALYTLVLSPDETVDGKSVAKVIGQFGIELYGALKPTTTGRKLDVSAGGEAGLDWANIGSPTTTVNLSGTTVKTATDVETDTADIQTRLPAALVSGRIDASVGAMASGVVTATAIATDAIGAAELAADAVTEIATGVWAAAARTLTANTNLNDLSAAGIRAAVGLASANLDTQIGTLATASALATVAGYIDTEVAAIKAKTDNLPSDPADASDIAAAFSTVNATLSTIAGLIDTEIGTIIANLAIVDGVVDAILVDTAEIGAAGAGLTALASAANLATLTGYVDSEVAAIKAKTDSLTFTVAGKVDSNVEYVNAVLIIGTGTTGDEWGPA